MTDAPRTETPDLRAEVIARHRRGDFTEEGWQDDPEHGIECVVCGRWPCDAIRAVLSATPAPERLDVERLARAIYNVWGEAYAIHENPPRGDVAQAIAAEYARLTEPRP